MDTVLLLWLGLICSVLIAAPVDCLFQSVQAEEIEPLEETDGPEEELLESAVVSRRHRKRVVPQTVFRGQHQDARRQLATRLASADPLRRLVRPAGGLSGRNGCEATLRC